MTMRPGRYDASHHRASTDSFSHTAAQSGHRWRAVDILPSRTEYMDVKNAIQRADHRLTHDPIEPEPSKPQSSTTRTTHIPSEYSTYHRMQATPKEDAHDEDYAASAVPRTTYRREDGRDTHTSTSTSTTRGLGRQSTYLAPASSDFAALNSPTWRREYRHQNGARKEETTPTSSSTRTVARVSSGDPGDGRGPNQSAYDTLYHARAVTPPVRGMGYVHSAATLATALSPHVSSMEHHASTGHRPLRHGTGAGSAMTVMSPDPRVTKSALNLGSSARTNRKAMPEYAQQEENGSIDAEYHLPRRYTADSLRARDGDAYYYNPSQASAANAAPQYWDADTLPSSTTTQRPSWLNRSQPERTSPSVPISSHTRTSAYHEQQREVVVEPSRKHLEHPSSTRDGRTRSTHRPSSRHRHHPSRVSRSSSSGSRSSSSTSRSSTNGGGSRRYRRSRSPSASSGSNGNVKNRHRSTSKTRGHRSNHKSNHQREETRRSARGSSRRHDSRPQPVVSPSSSTRDDVDMGAMEDLRVKVRSLIAVGQQYDAVVNRVILRHQQRQEGASDVATARYECVQALTNAMKHIHEELMSLRETEVTSLE